MALTDFIPPDKVRALRDAMRERLAVARRQVHAAQGHDAMAEARAHLDFCCNMLDAVGWDDQEPEPDVPVERVRDALRAHLETERELADTHDEGARERAEVAARLVNALLEVTEPEA